MLHLCDNIAWLHGLEFLTSVIGSLATTLSGVTASGHLNVQPRTVVFSSNTVFFTHPTVWLGARTSGVPILLSNSCNGRRWCFFASHDTPAGLLQLEQLAWLLMPDQIRKCDHDTPSPLLISSLRWPSSIWPIVAFYWRSFYILNMNISLSTKFFNKILH